MLSHQSFRGEDSRGEVVGEALAAFLEVDLEEGGSLGLVQKCRDTWGPACLALPGDLRLLVWEEEYLGRADRRDQLYEDWVSRLARGRVQDSVKSLVRDWVAGQHAHSPVLGAWGGPDTELLTMRVLSLVCRGEGDLSMLYWLQPLTLGLEDRGLEEEEAVLDLGWRLSRLVAHCSLEEDKLHRLVDGVYRDLAKRDPQYHFKLSQLSLGAERVRSMEDLLPGVLATGEAGIKIHQQLLRAGGSLKKEELKKCFTDGGKVWVRKWISEGFVSVLRRGSLCYLWDMLALQGWTAGSQHTAALAILLLIQPWVIKANSYDRLQSVLMQVANILPPACCLLPRRLSRHPWSPPGACTDLHL